jgi:NADP-dependent 3-hydroxy acid dehydrogenase YdfG
VARRRDRLEALAAEIDQAGGTALVVEADLTDRTQAEAAVQQTVERFGGLDTLVNNAGLMLLGPVVGADAQEWDRMIAINIQGLLSTTRAALPHLLQAAEQGPRRSLISSTSARSPAASPGTATACTASPSSA